MESVFTLCAFKGHNDLVALPLKVIAPCSCHGRSRAWTRNSKHPLSQKVAEFGIKSLCCLVGPSGRKNDLTFYNRPVFFCTGGFLSAQQELKQVDPSLEQHYQIAYGLDSGSWARLIGFPWDERLPPILSQLWVHVNFLYLLQTLIYPFPLFPSFFSSKNIY